MEDLEGADSPPVNDPGLAEANNDPRDPLKSGIDEEDSAPTPPIAEPTMDMDAVEDDQAPISAPAGNDSDDDSDALSEVDEAQFEDFDANAIAIEERPRVVDASDVAQLGKHKRKREDGDNEAKKKRKEGKRDKPKKSKRRADDEDNFEGGPETDGKRRRKEKVVRRERSATPENFDNLTPEERRKKEFSRQLDEALKKPKTQRRKGGIDLEQMADSELEEMRKRMADAAQADTIAREQNKPAMHKLKMLPEVVALLNRNTLQNALVDPDINLLESVRFFLEPLNDGSLPAYNIQRELFACLAKLPITKDALVASGIGKVTHFYTKTTKAEPAIKRQAERLVGDWTRPILKRTDDYRKREFEVANYDPTLAPIRSTQGADKAAKAAAVRKAALALPMATNRARVEGGVGTYSIAPRSDLSRVQGVKRLGASGDEMFRKLKARHQARGSARPR